VLQRRKWSPKKDVETLLQVIDEKQKMLVAFTAKLRSLKTSTNLKAHRQQLDAGGSRLVVVGCRSE